MNINDPLASTGIVQPLPTNQEKRNEVADNHMRMPYSSRMSEQSRGHLVAVSGEFIGTLSFLFLALAGAQVANNDHTSSGQTIAQVGANPQQLQYISLCFGFSLVVNAWVFFRISGSLFNPAVTLAMCLIGGLSWFRGALLFLTQIVAGIAAAGLVSAMFPGPLAVETKLGNGTSIAQGVFIEAFLTAQLIFTIFMLAAEKHRSTFIAPVGIGLTLFVTQLVGVNFTGASLNPARTFGPAVINHQFQGYHWIYWVGPLMGALLAVGFYKFIKVLEYETINPNQDSDGREEPKSMTPSPCRCASAGDRSDSESDGKSEDTMPTHPARSMA